MFETTWRRAVPIALVLVSIPVALAIDVLLSACAPPPSRFPRPPVARLQRFTIELTENGVSPVDLMVTFRNATQLEFVNRDNEVHEIHSDPHTRRAGGASPHSDCSVLNVGVLTA